MIAAYLFLSFLLTAAGVAIFRRLAVNNARLLDVPNERSSHTKPVTRGAGIAIVVVVLGLYSIFSGTNTNLSYLLAAAAIAVVSFLDDVYSLPLTVRLAVHFAAATAFVYFTSSYPGIGLSSADSIDFGRFSSIISVVFIVWVINAYNFMDGIDGIAGIQAFGAGIGWVIAGVATGITSYSFVGAVLCGSCAGFLIYNWQPARVFMGDVGSTFLGFTLAVLPLIDFPRSVEIGPSVLSAAIVFLWLFLFDTLFTRARQVITLKPFWRPHRDHLYQRIVRGGRSHQAVAAYFGFVAIATAFAYPFAGKIGVFPLIILLLGSAALLLLWAREKKIDVS